MDDFTRAFMMSYQNGLARREKDEQRQGLKDFAKLIADDSTQAQSATKDRLIDNPNYQFGQSVNSLNDLLSKDDLSLPKPQTPQTAPQFSLNSLIEKPTQPQPMTYAKGQLMQAFDFNKYNSLLAKGLESGVDPNAAFSMLNNYKKNYDEQYNKQKDDSNWDAFNTLKTPQEKLMFAAKNKMPMDSIKMLMSPDVETQVVELGGKKMIVGKNKYTNQFTDMMTGNPLTADDLKVTMTEYQQKALESQEKDRELRERLHVIPSGSTVYAANNHVPSGGANGGKYVEVPGLGSMTVNELLIRREAARPKKKVVEDMYGQKTTVDEGDPTSYAILDRVLQGVGTQSQQSANPDGATWYSQKFEELRSKGFTEQEAYDRMTSMINGG